MHVSKAKAFGNVTFQQGMENISSVLPWSFYGVERAQGQLCEARSLFSPWLHILRVQANAFCLAPAKKFKDPLFI